MNLAIVQVVSMPQFREGSGELSTTWSVTDAASGSAECWEHILSAAQRQATSEDQLVHDELRDDEPKRVEPLSPNPMW